MGRKKMELDVQNVIIDLHYNAGLSYNYIARLFALNIKASKSTIYNICRKYKNNQLPNIKTNLPNHTATNTSTEIDTEINTNTEINTSTEVNKDTKINTNTKENTDTEINTDTKINTNTEENLEEKCITSSEIEPLKDIDTSQILHHCEFAIQDYLRRHYDKYHTYDYNDLSKEAIIQIFKILYPQEYELYDNEDYESGLYPHVDFDSLDKEIQLQIQSKAMVRELYTIKNILPQEEINKLYQEIMNEIKQYQEQKQNKNQEHQKQMITEINGLMKKIPTWIHSNTIIRGISLNKLKSLIAIIYLYRKIDLPQETIIEQQAREVLTKISGTDKLEISVFKDIVLKACDTEYLTNFVRFIVKQYEWYKI